MTTQLDVDGYVLRLDRRYDPRTHLWVLEMPGGLLRVGLDSLTADTYGALAQLEMSTPGTAVERGEAFGSLEAAKFVGPLLSPVSGVIAVINAEALANPELVLREPYDDGWLAEFAAGSTVGLFGGGDAQAWFAREISDYREKGLLAE